MGPECYSKPNNTYKHNIYKEQKIVVLYCVYNCIFPNASNLRSGRRNCPDFGQTIKRTLSNYVCIPYVKDNTDFRSFEKKTSKPRNFDFTLTFLAAEGVS